MSKYLSLARGPFAKRGQVHLGSSTQLLKSVLSLEYFRGSSSSGPVVEGASENVALRIHMYVPDLRDRFVQTSSLWTVSSGQRCPSPGSLCDHVSSPSPPFAVRGKSRVVKVIGESTSLNSRSQKMPVFYDGGVTWS